MDKEKELMKACLAFTWSAIVFAFVLVGLAYCVPANAADCNAGEPCLPMETWEGDTCPDGRPLCAVGSGMYCVGKDKVMLRDGHVITRSDYCGLGYRGPAIGHTTMIRRTEQEKEPVYGPPTKEEFKRHGCRAASNSECVEDRYGYTVTIPTVIHELKYQQQLAKEFQWYLDE